MNPKAPRGSFPSSRSSRLGATIARLGQLAVELSTAHGCIFDGLVSEIEIELASGALDFRSTEATYFTMPKTTVLVLRQGGRSSAYRLTNASASLRRGRLTVLAERIEPMLGP